MNNTIKHGGKCIKVEYFIVYFFTGENSSALCRNGGYSFREYSMAKNLQEIGKFRVRMHITRTFSKVKNIFLISKASFQLSSFSLYWRLHIIYVCAFMTQFINI